MASTLQLTHPEESYKIWWAVYGDVRLTFGIETVKFTCLLADLDFRSLREVLIVYEVFILILLYLHIHAIYYPLLRHKYFGIHLRSYSLIVRCRHVLHHF